MEENQLEINALAPKFEAKAYHQGKIVNVKLTDYKGKLPQQKTPRAHTLGVFLWLLIYFCRLCLA